MSLDWITSSYRVGVSVVSSESSLNEAQESLVEALDEAQATLEAATGSTLSASELQEFTAEVTTH